MYSPDVHVQNTGIIGEVIPDQPDPFRYGFPIAIHFQVDPVFSIADPSGPALFLSHLEDQRSKADSLDLAADMDVILFWIVHRKGSNSNSSGCFMGFLFIVHRRGHRVSKSNFYFPYPFTYYLLPITHYPIPNTQYRTLNTFHSKDTAAPAFSFSQEYHSSMPCPVVAETWIKVSM